MTLEARYHDTGVEETADEILDSYCAEVRTYRSCIANPREAVALVDLTLHCTALSATVSGFLVDWTGLDWTLQVAVAVVVAVAVAISRDSQVSSTDT